MLRYWNAGWASVVGANKRVWRGIRERNEEATSIEMKRNMGRRESEGLGMNVNDIWEVGGGGD